MKKLIFLISVFGLFSELTVIQAQDYGRHEYTLELDPLPYALRGAGGHLGWSPKSMDQLAFGLGFISQIRYPELVVNMHSKNRDQGWSVKINQGMGTWIHYYFREKNDEWFVGLQMFTQEMELTNLSYQGESDRTNTLLLAFQAGYVWYPFKRLHLFMRPWGGFGYQTVISGTFEPDKVDPDLKVGSKEYFLTPFMPFVTFHLGYRF